MKNKYQDKGHNSKKRLARRMMTPEEIRNHIPIFQSKAWLERSGKKFKKQLNQKNKKKKK